MKPARFHWIAMAVLAFGFTVAASAAVLINNQTVTLPANTTLSLDTGKTSSSGGDFLWNGSAGTITFNGSAKGGSLSAAEFGAGMAGYNNALSLLSELETTSPGTVASTLAELGVTATSLPASSLMVGSLFAVITNGENAAVVLVTANSGGSISLVFTTYGTAVSAGPTITAVISGSSTIPAGFPNSGVAPSSLVEIQGTNLADPNTQAVLENTQQAGGIPLTVNHASVSVAVNGTIVHPGLYYACTNMCGTGAAQSQIAFVLPAATPVGNGTVTVTNNGVASSSFPIQVVASAPGLDEYPFPGGTLGVAQHVSTYQLVTFTNSASYNETLILWATGLGADPLDSDTSYIPSPHAISVPLQIYIGGVLQTIAYQGSSVFPGVDQINVTVSPSTPTGCYQPLALVTNGNFVSNITTLSVMPNGGVCQDPIYGINGTQITTSSQQINVSSGNVFVVESTSPGSTAGTITTTNEAAAIFEQVTGSFYGSSGSVSLNGCITTQNLVGGVTATVTGIDAGTVSVQGPTGSPVQLTEVPQIVGDYFAQLAAGAIPQSGGNFTFTGTGGSTKPFVGPFQAVVTFPNPVLDWENQAAAATVTRSGGLTVQWTGGAPGTYVVVSGSSSNGTVSGSYTCIFPQSALTGTVAPYVLLALPSGTGSTAVENVTNYSTFSLSGTTSGQGLAFGAVSFNVNSTYK